MSSNTKFRVLEAGAMTAICLCTIFVVFLAFQVTQ